MSLTDAQRRAGIAFRDACQARLPGTDLRVPPWIRHMRHECEGRHDKPLSLTEHYVYSPEYWVCYCSVVGLQGERFPHDDCQGGKAVTLKGLFGFHWKQGTCRACGVTARSDGQVVLAAGRQPLLGAIVEEFNAEGVQPHA